MLDRLPALLTDNPTAGTVLIETSVNDFSVTGGLTIAQSEANMRAMIAPCELAGYCLVVATSAPFTIATNFSWSKQTEGNKMTTRVAAERNIPLVDLFNPLTDLAGYQTTDGLHPNVSGQQVWADNIAKVIAATQTGPQQEPLLGNLIIDRFTRSDSTNTLGTTPTGHAWTAGLGTCGIHGRQGLPIRRDQRGLCSLECW
ncbi:MAG: GDSL-like Lipase/Acylhydrolase family [Homoserinimonas sp.]|nr:GDSL-like Lipase/Acylhydrolase family [Homoserinimonas sp.]